jgi:hypothetical protein
MSGSTCRLNPVDATLMIFDLFYHQSVQPPDGIELARYPHFGPTATDDE